MTESHEDPSRTPDAPDQDTAPASEPAGAAQHDSPTEDQDAGPASEPAGGSGTPES